MVKWSNPGKGVAPSPTSRCSSYWKRSFLVALDNFYLGSTGTDKSTMREVVFIFFFFFFWIITISGLLVGMEWSVCILRSQKILRVSFSGTDLLYYLLQDFYTNVSWWFFTGVRIKINLKYSYETQLNGFKYSYVTLIILFNNNHLFASVEWLQVLICNTNK